MARIYKAEFDNDVNDPAFFLANNFEQACKKAEKERAKRQKEARYKINGGDGTEVVEINSVSYKHSFT